MCDSSKANQPQPIVTASVALQQDQKSGSRRRRLWELPKASHCPLIGVCFPIAALRRAVGKSLGGKVLAEDYEVHVGAVAECATRNKLSEVLQRELEQRYAASVQLFKPAKTAQEVWQLWAEAVNRGDVAGPFWAALTHPRCDGVLEDGLCRDMHMIQHQAGAINTGRYKAAQEKNVFLTQELNKVQSRGARMLAEKTAETEQLKRLVMQARMSCIAKDTVIADLQSQLDQLRSEIPDLDTRTRLQQQVLEMGARQREMEAQIRQLKQQLHQAVQRPETCDSEAEAEAKIRATEKAPAVTVKLHNDTVLCVGGRTGNLAAYRRLVEQAGGRFTFHDGGLEDSQSVLDASLSAADMVICQTGCISHGAYWRVKDFCKRNGKRCIFVDNPSSSALARSLEELS